MRQHLETDHPGIVERSGAGIEDIESELGLFAVVEKSVEIPVEKGQVDRSWIEADIGAG